MKRKFLLGVLLLALFSSSAFAACPGTSSWDGCTGCITYAWTKSYSWTKTKYWNVNIFGKCVSTTIKKSNSCGSC